MTSTTLKSGQSPGKRKAAARDRRRREKETKNDSCGRRGRSTSRSRCPSGRAEEQTESNCSAASSQHTRSWENGTQERRRGSQAPCRGQRRGTQRPGRRRRWSPKRKTRQHCSSQLHSNFLRDGGWRESWLEGPGCSRRWPKKEKRRLGRAGPCSEMKTRRADDGRGVEGPAGEPLRSPCWPQSHRALPILWVLAGVLSKRGQRGSSGSTRAVPLP